MLALSLNRERVAPFVLLGVLMGIAAAGPLSDYKSALVALVALPLGAYVVWRVHPAWTLSIGLVLSVMAGNWPEVGIPGALAPDRLLLVGGIMVVLLRGPAVRDREPLVLRAPHWAMILVLAWMGGSALAAGTLADRSEQFQLLERVGLFPLLLFLVAPVAFETERHRRILLVALVGLGGYLGFTALMETVKIDALVFPSFITDPTIGYHADRARGPFLEAVTNGAGLYIGMVAAVMALFVWTGRQARQGALLVIVLCAGGILFTETRSVWLGAVLATTLALLAVKELRRWLIPALGVGLAVVALSLAVVPGLADSVTERKNDERSVWDRSNLTTAAVNMVEAYPLVGVGWGRFQAESAEYFWQNPDFPLTAGDVIIHNVYLTYAAETGLVGAGLWVGALLLGAAAALRPGRPEARPWQIAFGAFLVFYLTIATFVFSQVFPNNMVWLLAGVAVGAAGTAPRQAAWPRT